MNRDVLRKKIARNDVTRRENEMSVRMLVAELQKRGYEVEGDENIVYGVPQSISVVGSDLHKIVEDFRAVSSIAGLSYSLSNVTASGGDTMEYI